MTIIIIIVTLFSIAVIIKTFNSNKSDAFGNIGEIVSIFNKGFSLTGGLRATTRDTAYKNSMIIGQSGSGKTSTVLIATLNALARGNSSIVVLDFSGEIYSLMSYYLSKKYKIYCIDFSKSSDGFNPLNSNKYSDIQKTASSLIKNSGTESKSDLYWSASAEKLLCIFIQYLMEYVHEEYRTMANLLLMVETFAGEPHKIDKCFSKVNKELLTSYKALIAVGEKTLSSTVSTALVSLKLFKNPEIARCTAISTFNFENFRKEKSILFINIPLPKLSLLAPYSTILFEQLFDVVLSRIPKKNECSIFAILDEMVTMRFQNLGLVFSNIRKYKGGCIGLIQDQEMLKINFSAAESHSILTNSFSKVFLPGQPHLTCKMLEEMIGKDEHNKPVMSAAQIRMSEEAIIIVGNKKPYLEKMIPFYKHWLLKRRTKLPPYKAERKISFDKPPMLEF